MTGMQRMVTLHCKVSKNKQEIYGNGYEASKDLSNWQTYLETEDRNN